MYETWQSLLYLFFGQSHSYLSENLKFLTVFLSLSFSCKWTEYDLYKTVSKSKAEFLYMV
jgi:hypothetical protein